MVDLIVFATLLGNVVLLILYVEHGGGGRKR